MNPCYWTLYPRDSKCLFWNLPLWSRGVVLDGFGGELSGFPPRPFFVLPEPEDETLSRWFLIYLYLRIQDESGIRGTRLYFKHNKDDGCLRDLSLWEFCKVRRPWHLYYVGFGEYIPSTSSPVPFPPDPGETTCPGPRPKELGGVPRKIRGVDYTWRKKPLTERQVSIPFFVFIFLFFLKPRHWNLSLVVQHSTNIPRDGGFDTHDLPSWHKTSDKIKVPRRTRDSV